MTERAPDPIHDARAEFARIAPPSEDDLRAQRGRLDAAMHAGSASSRRRWSMPRRWLPASGIAVAGVTAAILVAVALQPGRGTDEPTTKRDTGLRLVTGAPGGAFAGLDLESASAADVLAAAGDSAAAGAARVGATEWTYVRLESTTPNVSVTNDGPKVTVTGVDEMWIHNGTGRKFAISEATDPIHGTQASAYYEDLRTRTTGSVGWMANDGSPGERRASWHTSAGDGEITVRMHMALRDRLPEAASASDVAAVLDDVIDMGDFTFRDGMACTRARGGLCMGFGSVVGARLTPEQSRTAYGRGLLLNTTAYDVYGPGTTRAIYEYLASLDGLTLSQTDDGSGNVVLLFTSPGAPPRTGERVVLDGDTGRVVERGRADHGGATRWTATGGSDAPMVGGTLCSKHADACDELRDLAERLEDDPNAQFEGVVDWMFISQFCDGMINRDGTPKQGDHLPRSMSKDPKVKAEREACERREAAAAAAAPGG